MKTAMPNVLLQVSEAAEQTALDICAAEQTSEMLTQVWVTHLQPC